MIPDMGRGRRALLRALACVALVSASPVSVGVCEEDESREKATPEKAGAGRANRGPGKTGNEEEATRGAAKKVEKRLLTVIVRGKDKKIPQAEVKVKFPGSEERRPTDEAGEARFSSPGSGTAEVRVIAVGWQSALQQVVLTEAPQRLTIELTPLPDAR